MTVHGDCTRKAAWKYVSGLFMFVSMKMPHHGFTVTPVVSFPQVSVMVREFKGSSIDSRTLSSAAAPIPASEPAQTFTV
ncbi:hypothetical protein ACLUWK_04895 [Bifidobacterium apri]|uniref:hypothetical protein n=1 Tax=Bifidobacterium apri TaxID=1769423 RepID=UPI003992E68A